MYWSPFLTLKGQCHEIFCFWFFSWTSFPQASDYTIRAVSNFFENSRRYSQLKVCHWCQPHRWQLERTLPPASLTPVANLPPVSTTLAKMVEQFATGVADTGGKFVTGVVYTSGAPWLANISANFWKNSKRSKWKYLELGGNWFMKKTRSKKSRDTVPLKAISFSVDSPFLGHNWSFFA